MKQRNRKEKKRIFKYKLKQFLLDHPLPVYLTVNKLYYTILILSFLTLVYNRLLTLVLVLNLTFSLTLLTSIISVFLDY